MNERERFIAILRYQTPDKVPFAPGKGRRSTRERWHREGLPTDVPPGEIARYAAKQVGIELDPPVEQTAAWVQFTMNPEFEEKVIERRSDSQVVQDWKGNICEIGLEFSPGDLRGAPDFCTRSWIKCPVETREDWQDMKRRYDVDDPVRFPDDWKQRAAKLKDRTYYHGLNLSGPFWQLREWLGFEGLCMLLLDDPAWTQEMIDFWEEFVASMLERVLADYVPDVITINEDMAYKEKPMIGPEQSRRFMVKTWKRWGEMAKAAGVPIYMVDSDGYAGSLIPVWIEGGFNVNGPQEVAAGNDLPADHAKFGQQMAYQGGIDKRKMAVGGEALEAEMARLKPVCQAGGYLPGCDHGVPSDVSWPNYLQTCRLLGEMTGWL